MPLAPELLLPVVGSSSSSEHVMISVLPRLTRLSICNYEISNSMTWLQLAGLTGLQALELQQVKLPVEASNSNNALGSSISISSALQLFLNSLTQLTDLRLGMPLTDAALAPTSKMPLKVFHIANPGEHITTNILSCLPNSVTQLHVFHGMPRVYRGPRAVPGPQLTSLLLLDLHGVPVQPEALSSMTLLCGLSIDGCGGNQSLSSDCLLAIGRLQRLQHLRLWGLELGERNNTEPFLALTASSQLRSLSVGHNKCGRVLAKGCAQHMFPLDRQWPFLTRLTMQIHGFLRSPVYEWEYDYPGSLFPTYGGEIINDPSWLTGEELCGVISCCPALKELDLVNALRDPPTHLLQLPASCTALRVGGVAFDDAAAAVVSQLSQLVRLSWSYSPLTDVGLEQFTALQQLTLLRLYNNHELSYDAVGYSFDPVFKWMDGQHFELLVKAKDSVTSEVRLA